MPPCRAKLPHCYENYTSCPACYIAIELRADRHSFGFIQLLKSVELTQIVNFLKVSDQTICSSFVLHVPLIFLHQSYDFNSKSNIIKYLELVIPKSPHPYRTCTGTPLAVSAIVSSIEKVCKAVQADRHTDRQLLKKLCGPAGTVHKYIERVRMDRQTNVHSYAQTDRPRSQSALQPIQLVRSESETGLFSLSLLRNSPAGKSFFIYTHIHGYYTYCALLVHFISFCCAHRFCKQRCLLSDCVCNRFGLTSDQLPIYTVFGRGDFPADF